MEFGLDTDQKTEIGFARTSGRVGPGALGQAKTATTKGSRHGDSGKSDDDSEELHVDVW